jgi:hypothetical protein
MSRFDRRLKGVGLRPGQSTCGLRSSQPQMLSSQTGNYGASQRMAYSPVVPQGQPMGQQGQITQDVTIMTEGELEQKTRQLEQYRLTAPTQELKLITGHEIRLNKLEWINLMCEKMCKEEEEQNKLQPSASIVPSAPIPQELSVSSSKTEEGKPMATQEYVKTSLHFFKLKEIDPLLKKVNEEKPALLSEPEVTKLCMKVYDVKEAKKPRKDYDAQINALAKQFAHSVRDIGVLKQQIAIVGPQLTKLSGLRSEIETLKTENKALREDISQLRLEKSGEIIKLNVEDKNIEEEVSKEVSEAVIKEVVQQAIKEKVNKIPAKA